MNIINYRGGDSMNIFLKQNKTQDYLYNSVRKLEKIMDVYISSLDAMKDCIDKCTIRIEKIESEIDKSQKEIEICKKKMYESINNAPKSRYSKLMKEHDNLREYLDELQKNYNAEKYAIKKLENSCCELIIKIDEVKWSKNQIEGRYIDVKIGRTTKSLMVS